MEKMKALVAKWRSEAERADRTAKKPSIGRRLEGNAYRVCADELESALADSGEAPTATLCNATAPPTSAGKPQGFEEWWKRTGIIGNGPLKPAALAAWNAAGSAARLREKE